jgi:hypothetical protein
MPFGSHADINLLGGASKIPTYNLQPTKKRNKTTHWIQAVRELTKVYLRVTRKNTQTIGAYFAGGT